MKNIKLFLLILAINFNINSMVVSRRLANTGIGIRNNFTKINIACNPMFGRRITTGTHLFDSSRLLKNKFRHEHSSNIQKKYLQKDFTQEDYNLVHKYFNLRDKYIKFFENFIHFEIYNNHDNYNFIFHTDKSMVRFCTPAFKQTLKIDDYYIIYYLDLSKNMFDVQSAREEITKNYDKFIKIIKLYKKIEKKDLHKTSYFDGCRYHLYNNLDI